MPGLCRVGLNSTDPERNGQRVSSPKVKNNVNVVPTLGDEVFSF